LSTFIAYPGYFLPWTKYQESNIAKIAILHSISRIFAYLGPNIRKSKNAKIAILHSISRIFAYLGQNIRIPKMLKLPSFIAYPGYLPTLDKISGVQQC
jgi:hypothetical protein